LNTGGKFTPEDRAAVLNLPHTIKTLEANHYIVREFDRATHSCVMRSGYAVRHKIVAGGERQIVSIHMKGEIVDLQNSLLGMSDHSVQMLTAGKVAFIPREEIMDLAFDRPTVGRPCGPTLWWTDLSFASGSQTLAAAMRGPGLRISSANSRYG
jgi:CRP-like cAMP-binding protein